MELRVAITPLDKEDKPIAGKTKCEILGLHPFETKAAKVEPPFQMASNVSSILAAIPGIPGAISGVVSGLGLSFGSLLKPKIPILDKAFLAGGSEFGWYLKSNEQEQKEGVHHGVAFLQMARTVAKLKVQVVLGSDWKGGGVDNQSENFVKTLTVRHPDPPATPQITDFTSSESLSLVIPRDDVKTLLNIDDAAFDALVESKRLVAFRTADKCVVTKGSLITLLGV